MTFSLGFLPYVLGGGLLSGLVDRVRPRRLGVSCDLASGVVAAVMAWPKAPVWSLLTLMLTLGLLGSLASAARGTLVRSTVATAAYVPARSLLKLSAQTAQIVGNAVGGALVVALGPSGAILVNAASFFFSASIVRLVVKDHPKLAEAGRGSLLADSLRGAREILGRTEIRRLLLFGWLVPMFGAAPEALAAPYVAGRHGSAALVGLWLGALPVGLIVGDLAGVRLLTLAQQRRVMFPAAVLVFVPYLLFALRPGVPVAIVLLVVSGAFGLYTLGLDGRVVETVPDRLFSRTMALNSAGLLTLQGVGFALAGAVAQGIGAAATIAGSGAVGLVAALLLRRVADAGDPAPAPPQATGAV